MTKLYLSVTRISTYFFLAEKLFTVSKDNISVSISTEKVAVNHPPIADHHSHPLVQVAAQESFRLCSATNAGALHLESQCKKGLPRIIISNVSMVTIQWLVLAITHLSKSVHTIHRQTAGSPT